MSTECVCIRKVIVLFNGRLEVFERFLVFLLKTVAVTKDAPGLRGMLVHLMGRLAQVSQLVLLLEMPQARAVNFHAFEAIWLHLLQNFVTLGRLLVFGEFEVATGNLALDPGGLLMLLREALVSFDSLPAPVVRLQLVSLAEFTQENDKVIHRVRLSLRLAAGALLQVSKMCPDLFAGR